MTTRSHPAKNTDDHNSCISGTTSAVETPRVDQMPSNMSSSEHTSNVETKSHVPTTIATSNAGDPNDELAAGSVYSYRSTRDITNLVQENFGRIFNRLNDTYLLPTDESEWTRLDKQHTAFHLAMGGLYPCPEVIEAVLAPSGAEPKRIIDIGCGTGSWAIEMAMRFPHARVKGIDLAPTPLDTSLFPPNLEFEIDDVNLGLTHFYGQYDLVHLRLARSGIKDIYKTFHELQLCLKPGGVLLIVECDIEFENQDHIKVPLAKIEGDEETSGVSENGSWLSRMHWEHIEAGKLAGSDWYRGFDVVDIGFWNEPLLDPDTAVSGSIYMPVGPWAGSQDPVKNQSLKYAGMMMRQVSINVQRAFHAALLRFGISQENLDQWGQRHDDELNTMKHKMMVRFPFCWARRRAGDNLPAPPLPPLPENATNAAPTNPLGQDPANRSSSRFPHPFFETFHSAEEALDARKRRRSTLGVLPTSAVVRAYRAMNGQI